MTGNLNEILVRANDDGIVILKHHVTCQFSVYEIVVDINLRDNFAFSRHLNLAERTRVGNSSGKVEGVENCRKC